MRFAKTALIGMLVVLWMPLASHCLLECVAGLEFLQCDTAVEKEAHNDDQHGCDPSCCSVEFAKYNAPRPEEIYLDYHEASVALPATIHSANLLPEALWLGALGTAPPEILRSWHFFSRAALPVRAPSIAS